MFLDSISKEMKAAYQQTLNEICALPREKEVYGLVHNDFHHGGNGKLEYSLISLIGVPIVVLLYIGSMLYGLRLTSFQSKKKSFAIVYIILFLATLAQVGIMLLERFYGEPIIVLTGVPLYIFMGVIGIALLIVDYCIFGIKGALFVIFFLASQWVGNIPFVEKHIKLVLGLVFSLIAFLVLMKAGPKEEKEVPKIQ